MSLLICMELHVGITGRDRLADFFLLCVIIYILMRELTKVIKVPPMIHDMGE